MEIFISCAENARPNINCLYVWSDLNCDLVTHECFESQRVNPVNQSSGQWKSHLNFISCYTCSVVPVTANERGHTYPIYFCAHYIFNVYIKTLSFFTRGSPVHQVSNRIDVIANSREMFVLFSFGLASFDSFLFDNAFQLSTHFDYFRLAVCLFWEREWAMSMATTIDAHKNA